MTAVTTGHVPTNEAGSFTEHASVNVSSRPANNVYRELLLKHSQRKEKEKTPASTPKASPFHSLIPRLFGVDLSGMSNRLSFSERADLFQDLITKVFSANEDGVITEHEANTLVRLLAEKFFSSQVDSMIHGLFDEADYSRNLFVGRTRTFKP